MIQLFVGAVLGAIAVVFYTAPKRSKAKGILGTGVRLPLPSISVTMPRTLEDLQRVDDSICFCFSELAPDLAALELSGVIKPAPLPEDAPTLALRKEQARTDSITSWIQLCAAADLYPENEIAWPPQVGDHPTIHALWGILDFRIRRLLLRGEVLESCPSAGQESTP
jgi:hypothetical protein